jgi:hypothetical protein
LHNIVRLRYASSPYFLELSTVSTSATMAGSLGLSGYIASPGVRLNPNIVISPGLSYSTYRLAAAASGGGGKNIAVKCARSWPRSDISAKASTFPMPMCAEV